jgi:uncharacterized protein YeaO (DUF488 family)
MSVRIVRLGSDRARGEGLRLGTVRHPPRGVPKTEHASGNWYDLWLPDLAPSAAAIKAGRGADSEREWATFVKRYRREMAAPERARLIALLAALSRTTDFSVGCYCEHESRCHRSILRDLLRAQGADIQ